MVLLLLLSMSMPMLLLLPFVAVWTFDCLERRVARICPKVVGKCCAWVFGRHRDASARYSRRPVCLSLALRKFGVVLAPV